MPGSHDVVLFGATGFTGGLTAEYLARHAPAGARIALAGRNPTKLAALRDRLAAIEPAYADWALLTADVEDAESLRAVAESAKVVVSTVGPYTVHGEPLVAACASAGTDYLDLCGEPEFVDRMYLRHHEQAARTGARLVHACGFDSLPYDLGVLYTVGQLPEGVPLRVHGKLRTNAAFSGGTYASALTAFSRPLPMARAARERARREPRPAGRRITISFDPPRRDPETGHWLVPMPTLDPQIVRRSAAALDEYGPDFRYTQSLTVKRLPTVIAGAAGLGVLAALAMIPPVRERLGRVRKPGTGPDPERRDRSYFKVRFTGEGGGKRVVTEVAGGDPGYDETAKMLSESALCLAFDDLPKTSGQVTAAVAMGDALRARLVDAGLVFRVVPLG